MTAHSVCSAHAKLRELRAEFARCQLRPLKRTALPTLQKMWRRKWFAFFFFHNCVFVSSR